MARCMFQSTKDVEYCGNTDARACQVCGNTFCSNHMNPHKRGSYWVNDFGA